MRHALKREDHVVNGQFFGELQVGCGPSLREEASTSTEYNRVAEEAQLIDKTLPQQFVGQGDRSGRHYVLPGSFGQCADLLLEVVTVTRHGQLFVCLLVAIILSRVHPVGTAWSASSQLGCSFPSKAVIGFLRRPGLDRTASRGSIAPRDLVRDRTLGCWHGASAGPHP